MANQILAQTTASISELKKNPMGTVAAGERGYQTLINDALRRAVEGEHLQANLRMMIREELGGVSRTKQRDI